MSRTGGFGVAGLLREELIRELFTDTESLFHPSTGLQGRPAVVPDRQRFNWPLAISQICNQPAATPAALQNVTFRRTGGISPSSVRLEALMGAPAAGIRLGISAALVDNALAATNVSLQSLPANSVRFDFDLVLGAIAEDAPLLDPILGLPFYFPRPSSEYSEGFRLSSRIYYEDASDPDDIDKNILVGSTGQVFRNPFVRGKGEDRPLVHQNGDPLTTITIGSVFLDNLEHITQVTVFSFESPAFVQPLNLQTSPGPADAFGRAYCLIDPNEPNTQAALALVATAQANVAAGVPGADNLLFLANISVFGRRVAEVVPIPHIWLQATAVSLSTYNSGFLTGIVQPCQPVAGGPITNLNLSVAADFGTLLGHLAPRAFATPFAPLALQVEALGEDHPFASELGLH